MQHRLRKHDILVKAFPNQVGSRLPMDPARAPLPLPTQTQHLSPEGTSDSSPPLAALSSGAYTAIRGRGDPLVSPLTDVACDQGGQLFHSSPMNPSFLLFQILKPFLEDSKYRNLLPLFVGHNLLLVSKEPKVKEMVRILKGVPFLPLLGEQAPLPVGGGVKGAGAAAASCQLLGMSA